MFFDEFGFSFRESLAPTWAPKGECPILRRVTNERRALSTVIALTLSGAIYKWHFTNAMSGAEVIVALNHVLLYLPERFVLVWDPAPRSYQ